VGGGAHVRREVTEKFSSCPSTFFGSTGTINRFDECFRDGQCSLINFLFAVLLLTVPPCPAICKSGGHSPPCTMDSAPVTTTESQRRTVQLQLLNELLTIGEGNSVLHFLNGTSLSKYDMDTMLLQVAKDSLA